MASTLVAPLSRYQYFLIMNNSLNAFYGRKCVIRYSVTEEGPKRRKSTSDIQGGPKK